MLGDFLRNQRGFIALALFCLAPCLVLADEIQYEFEVPRVALSELPMIRLQAIRDISHILATEQGETIVSNGRRAYAIRIIGLLGLSSFSGELASDITFQADEFTLKVSPYPSVESLMKIGLPAIPYILTAVSEERTDRELQFLACVMLVCYQDREFAFRRLERELDLIDPNDSRRQHKRQNLTRMVVLIQSDANLLQTVFGLDSANPWPSCPSLLQR